MTVNRVIINEKIYYAEYIWRKSKKDKTTDSKCHLFPFPKEGTPFGDKAEIIRLLKIAHNALIKRHDYKSYDKPIDCHICGKKNVEKHKFIFIDRVWSDGIIHYIDIHNIEPSDSFKDFIYNQLFSQLEKVLSNDSELGKLCSDSEDKLEHRSSRGTNIKKKCSGLQQSPDPIILERVKINNEEYVKFEKNKILISEALMVYGGKFKKYNDKYDINNKKYSEHAGTLDFDGSNLQKIVISGNTDRIDLGDDEIYMPLGLDEWYDYEYLFHTHPPTPKEGGRVDIGILYELPSFGDIYHFIDHYNLGNVIGSLVVTAEGLYNIGRHLRKGKVQKISRTNHKKSKKLLKEVEDDKTDIDINENKFYKEYMRIFSDIQGDAINKYGEDFSREEFYSEISQDMLGNYINKFNEVMNKYEIQIDFYPRKKDGKFWHIDTIFLNFSR
jgi:hypothetical protein